MARELIFSEELVPQYDLPDLLVCVDGTPVRDPQTWKAKRRPEILELFRAHMYGHAPSDGFTVAFEDTEGATEALQGRATRLQAVAHVGANGKSLDIDILTYLPRNAPGPVPVFCALNFYGNHVINADPGIHLARGELKPVPSRDILGGDQRDQDRGKAAHKWDLVQILDAGYGVMTAYAGDIDPDFDDGFQNGVHPLFYMPGQTRPAPDQWGTIGAWAWGLCRLMDYAETNKAIDRTRVITIGHSRLGKTALWAAAQDQRFASAISVQSGCGGAALSRRCLGETVAKMNEVFPHWCCENFKKYDERENDLPLDQHMLLALMAPRPVYVSSASEDTWADPKGEFLAAKHAGRVYELLGEEGLTAQDMPPLHQPVMSTVGYHIREGKHTVTPYDWQQYIAFLDRSLASSH